MRNNPAFQRRWAACLERDADGAPLLRPTFVRTEGPAVKIVDLRSVAEATGIVGYIPGSACLDRETLETLPDHWAIVLVSRRGQSAAKLAQELEERGRKWVAALDGGVTAWRRLGLGISRDPTALLDVSDLTALPGLSSGPITLRAIRDHIGDPGRIRWLRMASLLAQEKCSCIDGRDERAVLGTPGGDAGELLLLLAAIEQIEGVPLDEAAVTAILTRRIDDLGEFYAHTDDQAYDTLKRALADDPRTRDVVGPLTTPERWASFLQQPPAAVHDALLEHLVNPAHVGCGHVRLMLQHPEEYGTRRALVVAMIRAFFRLLWQGAPELSLTVLPGVHEEAAVLNVRIEEAIWELSRVPLVSPSFLGRQIFVNHPDVSSTFRAAEVRLFGGGRPELKRALDVLADRQLAASLRYLADGLPIFDATFLRDGSIEVREVS